MATMSRRDFRQIVDDVATGTAFANRMKRALRSGTVSSNVEYYDLLWAYETADKAMEQLEDLLEALQEFSYNRDEKSLK